MSAAPRIKTTVVGSYPVPDWLAAAPSEQAVVDATPTLSALGLGELVPLFDELLVEASPHYVYAESLAHGIAVVNVERGRAIQVDFLHIADVFEPEWDGDLARVRFRVQSGDARIQRSRIAVPNRNPLPLIRRRIIG